MSTHLTLDVDYGTGRIEVVSQETNSSHIDITVTYRPHDKNDNNKPVTVTVHPHEARQLAHILLDLVDRK